MSNKTILKSGSAGKEQNSDSNFSTLTRMLDKVQVSLQAMLDNVRVSLQAMMDTKLDKNITGDINMNGNRIINIQSVNTLDPQRGIKLPENDNDAVTKGYVDSITKNWVTLYSNPIQAEIDVEVLCRLGDQIITILYT